MIEMIHTWNWGLLYVPKVLFSKGSIFRRFYIPKVLYSESSMFWRFYVPKVSMFQKPFCNNIIWTPELTHQLSKLVS